MVGEGKWGDGGRGVELLEGARGGGGSGLRGGRGGGRGVEGDGRGVGVLFGRVGGECVCCLRGWEVCVSAV